MTFEAVKDWIEEHVPWVVGISIALVIGIIIFMGLKTYSVDGTATSKEWTRTITIEKYDWVHHSHDSSHHPIDAINVHHSSRIKTTYSTDSNGKKTTHYKTVYHVSYDVMEWTHSRNVQSTEFYPIVPYWPTVVLSVNPLERERDRNENYYINFLVKKKNKRYTTTSAEYDSINNNHAYVLNVNLFGIIRKVNL